MGEKLSVFLLLVIFISCSSKEVDTSSSNVTTETTTPVTQDIEEVKDTTTTLLLSLPSQPQSGFIDVNIPSEAPETLQIIEVKLNSEVSLMFKSFNPVKIHIHGIDLHLDIDGSMSISFEVNIAGEFEIEIHDSNIEFARIIVSP